MRSTAKPGFPDWGVESRARRGAAYFAQRALVLAIVVAVSGVVTYLLAPGIGLFAATLLLVLVGIAVFAWVANQGLLALRGVRARRLSRDEHERLWNIALGLASDLEMSPPALYVIRGDRPNALVCRARGPALAVTEGLLETYTRTELEAVVAHCLVRLGGDDLDRAMLAIALGPFGARTLPGVGYEDDVRAAAVTRYPPALAAAVEKAEPAAGRWAPLWFVGRGRGHRDRIGRAAAICDL